MAAEKIQGQERAARPRILATYRMPDRVERAFRDLFDITILEGISDMDEIIRLCSGYDALVCTLMNRISAPFVSRLPAGIKVIATYSVGYDHVDRAALKARGLPLLNTPDVLTDATADIAWLLLLGAARHAAAGERLLRASKWTGWEPTQLIGRHVTGKRLGILGYGRIGRAVARRAAGFDMKLHSFSRSTPVQQPGGNVVFHDSMEEVLRHSDFLSLHLPLSAQTSKWLNAERIAQLPRGAVVVNTARGGLVDEGALAAALQSGHIGAAGLDVFEGEPAINPVIMNAPNTFLLPHLGSATQEAREGMGLSLVDDLRAFFFGGNPKSVVPAP